MYVNRSEEEASDISFYLRGCALRIGFETCRIDVSKWKPASIRAAANSHIHGAQEAIEYRQENVEVLLRPGMVVQVVGSKCGWNPPSVVYAQVYLYPRHNVSHEGGRNSRQYPEVKQVVENGKEQNISYENGDPEAEFHSDVLTVGGRRMMQSVSHRGRLV